MHRVILLLAVIVALVPLAEASATDTPQCMITDYVEFAPSEPASNAAFGGSVAIDGNVAVVGARNEYSEGIRSGAAYVYERVDGQWHPVTRLTPSDATAGQGFGVSVAVDGDTIVVGSQLTFPIHTARCAAYVFRKIDGAWQQVAKLSNSQGFGTEFLGMVVAVHDNVVAIGSPQSAYRGAVFLFSEFEGIWISTLIPAPDPEDGSTGFGASVAITDDQLLIGAPYGVKFDGTRTGLVYLFQEHSQMWTSVGILSPADAPENTRFGAQLAESNNRLIVGTKVAIAPSSSQRDVYLFQRSGNSWSQREVLIAPDDPYTSEFGNSVAINGNTIAVSAAQYTTYSFETVLIYRDTGELELVAGLSPTSAPLNEQFGDSIAISDDSLMAGASYGGGAAYAGSAYLFDLGFLAYDCNGNGILDACDIVSGVSADCNGNTIPDECDLDAQTSSDCNGNGQPDECEPFGQDEIAKIDSPADTDEDFGWNVSMSGDRAIVGAPLNSEVATSGGAAYIYHDDADGWQQAAILRASDGEANERFGEVVSISGNTAIVGLYRDNDAGEYSGSAYVFREIEGNWQEVAKLTAGDTATGDRFGGSVAISGQTAVIGASGNAHAAYVFREIDGTWQEVQKLISPLAPVETGFGTQVAIDGGTIVVSQPYGTASGGRAFVFRETGDQWEHDATLVASDAEPRSGDYFGGSLAISQNTIAIGVTHFPVYPSSPTLPTRVCVYHHNGADWNQVATLTSDVESESLMFGVSVALHDDVLVVGDARDYSGAPTSRHGPVHVFREIAGQWQPILKLQPADGIIESRFGGAIATDGMTVLTGSPRIDAEGVRTGALYVHDIRDLSYVGDLDDDGEIDIEDLDIFVNVLLDFDPDPLHVSRADANCSGNVDGLDVQAFVTRWLGP